MLRARGTAAEIAKACGLEVRVIEGLHERRMGSLSGLSHNEGRPHYEADRACWMAGDLAAAYPGAESFAEVRDRAVPALCRLVTAHPGKTIVLVAHGVVIRVLLTSLAEGLSPSDFDRVPIEFVGVHEVVGEGDRWRLVGPPCPGPSPGA
jgi:broad specificity phosphatase PhoE